MNARETSEGSKKTTQELGHKGVNQTVVTCSTKYKQIDKQKGMQRFRPKAAELNFPNLILKHLKGNKKYLQNTAKLKKVALLQFFGFQSAILCSTQKVQKQIMCIQPYKLTKSQMLDKDQVQRFTVQTKCNTLAQGLIGLI